jgi:hypothetical protein
VISFQSWQVYVTNPDFSSNAGLNEMIDLNAKRITALENHVPEITLVLLYFVAIMAPD